jgi:hypothetical protein
MAMDKMVEGRLRKYFEEVVLSARSATRRPPKQRWGALPATPATRINECGEGRTAPLTVGRRWSRRRLGAEVPRRRGRCSRRRGPGSLLLPRDGVPVRLPPTAPGTPSTKRRSAPLPPPHSYSPHTLPLFSSCGGEQGRGKPQCDAAGGRGLDPGLSAWSKARKGKERGAPWLAGAAGSLTWRRSNG